MTTMSRNRLLQSRSTSPQAQQAKASLGRRLDGPPVGASAAADAGSPNRTENAQATSNSRVQTKQQVKDGFFVTTAPWAESPSSTKGLFPLEVSDRRVEAAMIADADDWAKWPRVGERFASMPQFAFREIMYCDEDMDGPRLALQDKADGSVTLEVIRTPGNETYGCEPRASRLLLNADLIGKPLLQRIGNNETSKAEFFDRYDCFSSKETWKSVGFPIGTTIGSTSNSAEAPLYAPFGINLRPPTAPSCTNDAGGMEENTFKGRYKALQDLSTLVVGVIPPQLVLQKVEEPILFRWIDDIAAIRRADEVQSKKNGDQISELKSQIRILQMQLSNAQQVQGDGSPASRTAFLPNPSFVSRGIGGNRAEQIVGGIGFVAATLFCAAAIAEGLFGKRRAQPSTSETNNA